MEFFRICDDVIISTVNAGCVCVFLCFRNVLVLILNIGNISCCVFAYMIFFEIFDRF